MRDYVQYASLAQTLHPQAVEELQAMAGHTPAGGDLLSLRDAMGWPAKDIRTRPLTVSNKIIEGHVNVRIYRCTDSQGPLPAVLFLHGGGFFGGSLDNVEYPCRALADLGDVVVVSVDYALAPEIPWPGALLDCYTALRWVHEQGDEYGIDRTNITIAGDSAGGNLSLATGLLDVTLGTKYLSRLIGFYPATSLSRDATLADTSQYPAREHKALIDAYLNDFYGSMGQVAQWYAGDNACCQPFISPLFAAPALLAQLPPLLICCGEFDPLRLQVEAFVEKTRQAGGEVTFIRYNGMVHAFMDKVGILPHTSILLQDAVAFLHGNPPEIMD